ncbi:MAG: chitobiase/beta-hexosaminidase C-terminal domain-containing protein, partial [Luminiphilus sp.]|nr:chitobiase/beta-hexosaminidase C-terminal domain-containing protein [Luminiphilus sp.]
IRLSSLEEYMARKQYTPSNSQHKPHIEAVWCDGAFRLVMDSPADIVYTLDGTLPDADSDRYVEPLHLSKSARICAAALVDGCLIGEVRLSLEKHLGLDQVIHLNATHGVTCEPGAQSLINGVLAHDRLFDFTQWARFEGVDMDATIQFDKPTVVSSIRLGFDATGHRSLHRPSAFSIFAGTVRDDSALLIRIDKEEILAAGGALECVISPAEVNSLRVVAHNNDVAWCWSSEATVPTTIFIDEIVVH